MDKVVFMFPGQGSQRVGMAKEFYDGFGASRRVFETASEAAGFSLEEICFTENEKINQTRFTQPALLTACCAIAEAVKEEGIRADMTAGLSLGEYCGLVTAGALDFQEAVSIVCRRGIYMEEAVPEGRGGMSAVISRKELPADEICRETGGRVWVANYNCPGQQVITGEKEAVEEASSRLMKAGAMRVIPLKVSGPFHSPMLSGAGTKLKALLDTVTVQEPEILFVSNVTAKAARAPEEIRELLGRQVFSPVRWQQSVEYLIRQGAGIFVEIGPGKSLSKFVKKIDNSVKVLSVEKPEDIGQVKAALQER